MHICFFYRIPMKKNKKSVKKILLYKKKVVPLQPQIRNDLYNWCGSSVG